MQHLPDLPFPIPLSDYSTPSAGGLLEVLKARIDVDPINAIATVIFFLAVMHTFFAARFADAARRLQNRRDAQAVAAGLAKSRVSPPNSCTSSEKSK